MTSHKSETNFTNRSSCTIVDDDYEDYEEDEPVEDCEDVLLAPLTDSLEVRGGKRRNLFANKRGKENFKPSVAFQSDCGTRKTWI